MLKYTAKPIGEPSNNPSVIFLRKCLLPRHLGGECVADFTASIYKNHGGKGFLFLRGGLLGIISVHSRRLLQLLPR